MLFGFDIRAENTYRTENSLTSCIFAEFHYTFYGHFDKISKQLKWAPLWQKKTNNSNKVYCVKCTFQNVCNDATNFIIVLQKQRERERKREQQLKFKFPKKEKNIINYNN